MVSNQMMIYIGIGNTPKMSNDETQKSYKDSHKKFMVKIQNYLTSNKSLSKIDIFIIKQN